MNPGIEMIERVGIAMEGISRETPAEFHVKIAETINGGLNRGTRIADQITHDENPPFPPRSLMDLRSCVAGKIRANREA